MSKITVGSLYAGIGGIDKGFLDAGAEVLWANEWDSKACLTYRINFPNHNLIEEDVYKLDAESLEKVDIIAAGFPCQAFSVAGYRKGFADERGNHFFRILEIAEILKPKALFLENVKNFVNHDKGNTWDVVYNSLKDAGYTVHFTTMNSMNYGDLPQNRERFYAVCFRKDENGLENYSQYFDFPSPIARNKSILDIIEKDKVSEKYYYGPERYMYDSLVESIKRTDTVYQWRRHYVRENKNNVCPTLTANMGTGGHNVPLIKTDQGIRKLTPLECFKFQGFDEIKLPDIADSHLYKQAGNSVTVPVIERIAKSLLMAIEKGDSSKYNYHGGLAMYKG